METLTQDQTFSDYLIGRTHRERVTDSLAAIAAYKSHEGRATISSEVRTTISKFAGWGTVAKLFADGDVPQWERQAREELRELLTADEYKECRRTILNAYPTSPLVVEAIWEFLRDIGFESGRVVDPGCGIANFKTFCPEDIQQAITYIGVEVEPLTFGMAKRLHPKTSFYNKSFTLFPFPTNSIDLVIGNFPFENGNYDPQGSFTGSVALHARFLIKSLELLKPGGLMCVITSTGLMDSTGQSQENLRLREWIDERAVFLGAVRLPAQTHEKVSGTQCTSDLILLQKRHSDEDDRHPYQWRNSVASPLVARSTGTPIPVNEYFMRHPERMIGVPVADRTTFGDDFALDWLSTEPLIDGIRTALRRWADDCLVLFLSEQPQQETPTMYATVQPAQSTPNTRPAWQSITVVPSQQGGIEIRFGAKPPKAVSSQVSDAGFRYIDTNKDPRWYTKRTPAKWVFAQQFAAEYGITVEIPANLEILRSDRTPMSIVTPQAESIPTPDPMPEPTQIVTPPAPPTTQPVTQPVNDLSGLDWMEAFIAQTAEFVNNYEDPATTQLKADVAAQLADYNDRRASGGILAGKDRLVWSYFLNKLGLLGQAIFLHLYPLIVQAQAAQAAQAQAAPTATPEKK